MAKKKIYKYGIEITKPFSKEMYTHNDEVALEMKRNILSEIHLSYSQAMGDIAANGGSDAGEKRLRKIGVAIEGSGYGHGYELDEIKDSIVNHLADIANWSIHQEYGYLCSEGIVPKLPMKMLGFDKATDGCWDCYWEEEDGPMEKVQYDDVLNNTSELKDLKNMIKELEKKIEDLDVRGDDDDELMDLQNQMEDIETQAYDIENRNVVDATDIGSATIEEVLDQEGVKDIKDINYEQ